MIPPIAKLGVRPAAALATALLVPLAAFGAEITLTDSGRSAGSPATTTTYLGQTPPGRQAERFAPEVLRF